MTPEQTLDWLAEQHKSQCNEDRPVQEWIRSMKSMLPVPVPDVPETDFGNMTKDEALKLALEALEDLQRQYSIYPNSFWDWSKGRDAITAIKQARSAPVQEPVAWCTKSDLENMAKGFSQDVPARSMRVPQLYPKEGIMLLYTTPPAAQPSQGETK